MVVDTLDTWACTMYMYMYILMCSGTEVLHVVFANEMLSVTSIWEYGTAVTRKLWCTIHTMVCNKEGPVITAAALLRSFHALVWWP